MNQVVWRMEEPLTAALVTRLGVGVGVVKVVRGRPWWAVMGFLPSKITGCFPRIFPRFFLTLESGCRVFEDETNRCDWGELVGMRFDRVYISVRGRSLVHGPLESHGPRATSIPMNCFVLCWLHGCRQLFELLSSQINRIRLAMYWYSWIHHKPQVHLESTKFIHSRKLIVQVPRLRIDDMTEKESNPFSTPLRTMLERSTIDHGSPAGLLPQLHLGINVMIGRLWRVLGVLTAMNLLAERLHQVLLGSLVKDGLVRIRRQAMTGRRGHFMARNRRSMGPSQSHHALDAFHVGFILFTLLLLAFTSLTLGSLGGCTSLQFARNKFQIIRHLDPALQEEQLQIAGLVFELNLIAIFEGFTDGTARSKHGKDLTPVRAFDPIQAGHQCILLFGGPGPPLAWQARFAAGRRGLGRGRHAGTLIQDLGRLRLRVVGYSWHVPMIRRHPVRSRLHGLCRIGIVLLEIVLQWTLLECQARLLLISTRRCRAMLILLRGGLVLLLSRCVPLKILIVRLRVLWLRLLLRGLVLMWLRSRRLGW